jgi:hypothetical protein
MYRGFYATASDKNPSHLKIKYSKGLLFFIETPLVLRHCGSEIVYEVRK